MDTRQSVQALRERFYQCLSQELCHGRLAESTRTRLLGMGDDRSAVFDAFPCLFLNLFPTVTADQALRLAYAGKLYMDYLCLEDAVTDGQPFDGRFVHAAIGGLVHEEALTVMRSLLGSHDPFWRGLAGYHQAYVRAVIAEREIQTRRPLTYARAERDRIAADKCASGKAAFVALALLDGSEEPPAALIHSYDAFCVSYQLYDDILDWRQDYTHGPYSYLVVQALESWQSHHPGFENSRPSPDELGQIIYYGHLAEDLLTEAGTYADHAVALVRDLDCPAWVAAIREFEETYARLATDLEALAETSLAARQVPAGIGP